VIGVGDVPRGTGALAVAGSLEDTRHGFVSCCDRGRRGHRRQRSPGRCLTVSIRVQFRDRQQPSVAVIIEGMLPMATTTRPVAASSVAPETEDWHVDGPNL